VCHHISAGVYQRLLADEPNTGNITARDLSIEPQIGRHFKARSQNQEKHFLASSCLWIRMEQLGSHWTDFHEI
jgi:hypothetical protein